MRRTSRSGFAGESVPSLGRTVCWWWLRRMWRPRRRWAIGRPASREVAAELFRFAPKPDSQLSRLRIAPPAAQTLNVFTSIARRCHPPGGLPWTLANYENRQPRPPSERCGAWEQTSHGALKPHPDCESSWALGVDLSVKETVSGPRRTARGRPSSWTGKCVRLRSRCRTDSRRRRIHHDAPHERHGRRTHRRPPLASAPGCSHRHRTAARSSGPGPTPSTAVAAEATSPPAL